MFLSKKWIFLLIAITGLSFILLLVIQFGWISKSVEMNRRQLDSRMREVSSMIRQAFLADSWFQKKFLSDSQGYEGSQYVTFSDASTLDVIRRKADAVLQTHDLPVSASIHNTCGSYCYLMNFVPPENHIRALDEAQYKICLCNNKNPVSFDIGLNLADQHFLHGASFPGLVWPSVILIILLIALFSYAIYVINKQKKLADLKNDFINNLTHEFNTPLFSIGITSNLLARSAQIGDSEKLRGYVELIDKEKDRIQNQVDKILQLTALQSGTTVMENEPVDLHSLLKDAMESFRESVAARNGHLQLQASASRAVVPGDRVHLLNALNNLLDNACKYSEGPPEIAITTANENNVLVIRIADKGIGMSKAEQTMVFDKFYRVKQGDRHDVKGFGLGLSYVKKVAELHRGSIQVISSPGAGAVFIIRLPYPPE
jgi:signal transduction histidine kinase